MEHEQQKQTRQMEPSVIPCLGSVAFTFVFVLSTLNVTASERILMLPASIGSHLLQMNSVAEGLIGRGHEVHTILNSRTKVAKGVLNPQVKVIKYDTGEEPCFQIKEFHEVTLAPELSDLSFFEKMKPFGRQFEMFTNECRGTIGHAALFTELERKKFDFVVVDGAIRCYNLIPYKLGVPFAVFLSFLPPDIPHAALQAPLVLQGPIDDMISGENTPHVIATICKIGFITTFFNSMEVFGDIVNISLFELQKQTQLMLYDVSKVLSTPMPLSPNVVNVGGLNVRKSKPLPEGELKQFVDSATDGFILVSFGSFAKYFPDRIICILLETFRDVPHKIVWKWDKQLLKDDQVLPSNVLAASWLPQNDVLGHENIKLFVTHCGNSGQHEALYHGIPMVGFPLFGDQMFNCKRVEGRFGRHIRAKDLTQEKLLNMIKHVISDRKYSDNIGKASAVFRDEAMEPRDTAAYWIDHVIKHGANHLRSQTNEMSWIQLLMWDVLFVLCAVVAVVMTLLFFVCRCLYRSCYRGLSSKEKAKQS
ncbi:UDP-glucuronosyltransferase 1A9-like isoform X1 [Lineus longissimus]|uniref:UDP-glucuronosyltransferase 1A9-like isoform X1 n=1 Tax=Lineus longissimus TaxID=88925 RepID=UPI00315C8E77